MYHDISRWFHDLSVFPLTCTLPSGNQTWQWKRDPLSVIFLSKKAPFSLGFSSHVSWHQRVLIIIISHYEPLLTTINHYSSQYKHGDFPLCKRFPEAKPSTSYKRACGLSTPRLRQQFQLAIFLDQQSRNARAVAEDKQVIWVVEITGEPCGQ